MHRLFWKIFLSFWLSLILFVVLSLIATTFYLESAQSQDNNQNPRARIFAYSQEAQVVADHSGIDGLKEWLQELDQREAIPILLLDPEGKDLLGRTLSPHLADRLKRSAARHHPMERRHAPRHPPLLINLPDGSQYRMLADFKAVSLGRMLRRPRVIAIPFIVSVLISGFMCFLLARYLTNPIRRLSQATQHFAKGKLEYRVAPALGQRRDEIAVLGRDFDQMAERLQAMMSAQKQLLSDVSHELRSPLARLQVALGLARQQGTGETDAALDRIEREAEHLNAMIGQLLSLSRLESGVGISTKGTVDLSVLLADVADNANFEASTGNRQVCIMDNTPATIEASEPIIKSALENVVRNALRYTGENTTVELFLEPDKTSSDWWQIRVRDHGPGVPERMLHQLFEPFVRIAEARDRDSGGYGLGLAIAKRAVQLHGGEITASNIQGGGLSICIRLPVHHQ